MYISTLTLLLLNIFVANNNSSLDIYTESVNLSVHGSRISSLLLLSILFVENSDSFLHFHTRSVKWRVYSSFVYFFVALLLNINNCSLPDTVSYSSFKEYVPSVIVRSMGPRLKFREQTLAIQADDARCD